MRGLKLCMAVGLILAVSATAGAAGVPGVMWGAGSPALDFTNSSGPSGVIFQFDTATGNISKIFEFSSNNWMWITGVADSGRYLYATHDKYGYSAATPEIALDLTVAKIDRHTGAVLSDTSIASFLGQTYSQINALEFHNGKLYGVENATSGSTIRGYPIEIQLDASGDVTGATKGAYIGPYPDAGLDYYNGTWYVTSWGMTDEATPKQGSLVYTSPDIMNTAFTQVGTSAVEGMGMIDGWEFDEGGNLFAVSWYGADYSNTSVYDIDTTTWMATSLYDLSSQLPGSIIELNGLSEVIPEPFSVATLFMAVGGLGMYYRRKRRMG